MAFKCTSAACLMLWCFTVVSCLPPTHHRLQKRNIRLCGNMLVDALAAVCSSVYYDPNAAPNGQLRKRNYAYLPPDSGYMVLDPSLTEFEGFMDPQTALDFLGPNQLPPRRQRGVADECCQQSCSFSTLVSYCGPLRRRK